MNSPTLTNRATRGRHDPRHRRVHVARAGQGPAGDKRADIWAFGVVLHEMLTGRRAFDGESVAETLGLIFSREPDLLTSLPATTPAGASSLIARCLVRDPRERLRDIGDGRQLIDDAIAGRGDAAPASVSGARQTAARDSWWPARLCLSLLRRPPLAGLRAGPRRRRMCGCRLRCRPASN